MLAAALLAIASLPDGSTAAGVVAFGVAGLGCSALLPLTISFAQADLVTMSAATAGLVIAAYQLGYGIAAFGAGPLQDAGVSLPAIFAHRRRRRRRDGRALLRHRPPDATTSRPCTPDPRDPTRNRPSTAQGSQP